MKKSKKRVARAAWQRRARSARRVAISLGVLLLLAGVGWYFLVSGDEEQAVYLTDPAPAFALETISGEEFTSSEHRGQHNLLLYFNEGMG